MVVVKAELLEEGTLLLHGESLRKGIELEIIREQIN
jgi:hypothetical protein